MIGAWLIVAIKSSTLLLPQSHEYNWTLCDDGMYNECWDNDDEDREAGQREVKLSASNIPARVLEEESACLRSAHGPGLLFQLLYYFLLLTQWLKSLLTATFRCCFSISWLRWCIRLVIFWRFFALSNSLIFSFFKKTFLKRILFSFLHYFLHKINYILILEFII